MDLQMNLVNDRIDDLRQTAQEIHAATGPSASARAASAPLGGLRRSLGLRLIGLGQALASPSQAGENRSAARMA